MFTAGSARSDMTDTCPFLPFQKAKILADRDKRAQQIQHSLRVVQSQIDGHKSGSKVLPEGKLVSLQNRVTKYTEEIEGFSKPLSDAEIEEMIKTSEEDEL